MKKEKTTSIRLTADGTKLVTKPSQKLGVTRSAVFELADSRTRGKGKLAVSCNALRYNER